MPARDQRRPFFFRSEPVEVVTSARLSAVLAALPAGGGAAVEGFWADMAAAGTPLVEPDVLGDPEFRAVTFLWREHAVAGQVPGSVVLHANKFTDYDDLASCSLVRAEETDVWHRTFRLRADWRASYVLGPLPSAPGESPRAGGRARRDELLRHAEPDPFNRYPLHDVRNGTTQSVAELDGAPAQLWADGPPDAARFRHRRMCSEHLDGERSVWIYTPPGGEEDSGPYPVLVLLDGEMWAEQHPIAATLDALVSGGRIPPLVAVLVGAADPARRISELACNPDLVAFLDGELLPAVAEEVRITSSADRTIVAGQSFGGLAAAHAGWLRPERFGNVIAQSGSFWWPAGTPFDEGAEWLTRGFAEAERRPVRFYLEVGLQEWGLRTMVRHLRDVLCAKGNVVELREYFGGHDRACWRSGLADGLIALTAKWSDQTHITSDKN